ncbi:sensor histidine kinase [Vallitaleaceae bacterium 9-2]
MLKIIPKGMQLLKSFSIQQRLLLLFSIQILIPLLFMGTMLYRTSRNIIQNKSIDYTQDLLTMVELRLNDFSNNVKVASQDMLYDRVIYNILAEDASNQGENNGADITQYEEINSVNNILRKACLSREEIQSIALISNHQTYYTYDSNIGRASIEQLLPYEKMKAVALEAGGEAVWFLDLDAKGEVKNLYVTRSIYDISNYQEIGLMAILIRREALERVYGDLSTEFMQSIAVVSNTGEWITGSGVETLELQQTYTALEFKDSSHVVDDKRGILLSVKEMKEPNWRILAEISVDKLNEDLYAFRTYFIIIMIATLLILSALSIFFAMDILTPIKRLVHGMKTMQESKTHDEIIIDRQDELGYLSQCFNDMSREIDILVNRVYKEQLTRKEAEIKTLQAQINPHFLFNTLESINWMARLNHVDEISEMVTALSALMEAGIGKGEALVSLEEEISFVDSYILIMKNRYGERLDFTKSIDESLLSILVPKLLLQPLVENAIYHGVDKFRRPGKVVLIIRRTDQHIEIEVLDNGKGMTAQEMEELNANLRERNDAYLFSEKSGMGIGLVNVNRRIKLFYGAQYGIRIESVYEEYMKVVLTLPVSGIQKGVKDYV